MKERQAASRASNATQKDSSRERAVAAARQELERLMEQTPCYTPFSLRVIIDSATPKPSAQPSTPDLVARLRKDAQELLNRAFAGQSDAAKEFCWFAHNLIRQLTNLSEKKQPEMSAIASTYEDWPVLYAPDDDPRAIYEKLRVGTDSFIERYAGRKINRDNPWTNLALLVLELMRWCKGQLLKVIRNNQPCRKFSLCFLSVGRTKIRIYYYHTPNGIFEIPEWCELCGRLPNKLRPETIDQFWKPARLAILEYWGKDEQAGGSAYRDALRSARAGKCAKSDESERRNNALDAIKRAMVSLAGETKQRAMRS
jgi:hypothetical protein